MIRFCKIGTRSAGYSTPRSPRAIITPSAASRIESRFSIASRRSIFAITRRPLRPAEESSEPDDVLAAAHEGEGDVVDAHRKPEGEIGAVLGGHRRRAQTDAREVDPLVIGDLTARDDLAAKPVLPLPDHAKLDQSVRDQDAVAHRDVAHQARIDDRDPPGASLAAAVCERYVGAAAKADQAPLQLADAEPGTLEIEEEPDVLADPLRGGADEPD